METLITITMTENEYEQYKAQQADYKKDHARKEALQHDCEKLAQMVCYALRGIVNDNCYRLGKRSADLLYDYAADLLRGIKQ